MTKIINKVRDLFYKKNIKVVICDERTSIGGYESELLIMVKYSLVMTLY